MPYIGNEPADRFTSIPTVQQFNGDGSTTAFTLSRTVSSDQDILVSVDGVIQDTAAYAVSSGTTLTFSAAPSTGTANIFVNHLGLTIGSVTHPPSSALAATTGAFTGAVGVGNASVNATLHVADGTNANVGSASTPAIQIGGANTYRMGMYTSAEQAIIDNQNGDDGVAIHVKTGGESLVVDGNGAVTMPNQPAFLARPTSNQDNIATSTDVTVVLGTEVFDQNADFASNLFTAPVAGRYQFSFCLNLRNVDSAADYYETQIVTSNRNYNFIQDTDYGQDSVYFSISGSALCDMDASDTARFKIVQAGGTAQTDISTESHFSGYLAC